MDDMISRQGAIEAINKALDRQTLLNSFVRKVAIDAIKQLPSAQPAPSQVAKDIARIVENGQDMRVIEERPHWIPVTERLPEKWNTTYLATIDYGKYGIAVGARFFFGDNIGWNDKAVLAWMPLPEPYKGVTE